MSRVLAAVRVSRMADETTSPERQLAAIERWAKGKHHQVIGKATDLDESAYKVPPLARPELGHWLTKRADDFDVIAWSRLDRAVRRMADMSDLVRWAKDHGKSLVFCSGPGGTLTLDMSSGLVSELIAQVLAFAAEMEAYAISERTTDSRSALRKMKRYAGGWTPFGYRAVARAEGTGYVLEPDPEYAPIVTRMTKDILAGRGPTYVANWLTTEHVPTSKDIVRIRAGRKPRGHRWRYLQVQQILRSRAVCGITELGGQMIRDETGLPLRFAEPIISDSDWRTVQDRLDAISKHVRTPRQNSHWLIGSARCRRCGQPLHSNRQRVKGRTYEYLRCHGVSTGTCRAPNVRLRELADYVDQWMADYLKNIPSLEEHIVPGSDRSDEIAEVTEAIGHLSAQVAVDRAYGQPTKANEQRLDALHSRLAALVKIPADPGRVEYGISDQPVTDIWHSYDTAAKRTFLLDNGVQVLAAKIYGRLDITIEPGRLEILHRLAATLPPRLPDGWKLTLDMTDKAHPKARVYTASGTTVLPLTQPYANT